MPLERLSITMVAPMQRECGVADYARYLLPELERLVDVRNLTDAAGFGPEMNAVDLIHIQHQYFLFGGVAPWRQRFTAFARRLTRPAVMTVHELVPPRGPLLVRAAVALSNRLHFGNAKVRRLIVHTEEDRARMADAGASVGRIEVVRHGVPPAPELPPRDRAREALGLQNRFVATLFGFISRRKGHLLALEALRELPEDAFLLIAGGRHPDDQTDYVGRVEEQIRAAGLQDRARMTGYLTPEQVAEVMSATDLALAPFTESSGSGSLAMAFACGKPILGSDIAPHREIVQETPGAMQLVGPDSAADLAAAISTLRDSPERLAALAEGARRYAAQHTYGRMAAETVAVYRSVLAEAG